MKRLLVYIACLAIFNQSYAQSGKLGKTILTVAGDIIIFNTAKEKTITIPSTGKTKTIVTEPAKPVLLAEQPIFYMTEEYEEEIQQTEALKNAHDEWANFNKKLKAEVVAQGIELPVGTYIFPLKNAVMNGSGYYVYYEAEPVKRTKENPNRELKPQTNFDLKPIELELDNTTKEQLSNIFKKLYQQQKFTPLVLDGQHTPWAHNYYYKFDI